MDAGDADNGRLEVWSLSFDDHAFLTDLPIGARLAAAAQLKFLDRFGHFPSQWAQIGDDAVAYLAEQLGADTPSAARSEIDGRTARRHRERILAHLGLRRMSPADRAILGAWLADTLCPAGGSLEAMVAAVFARCREQRLQPPARTEVERAVRAAQRAFRERLLAGIAAALAPEVAARIEGALGEPDGATGFHALKRDVGPATRDSVLGALERLAFIRDLALPRGCLAGVGRPWIETLARRASGETASEMRRHAPERRLGLMVLWLMVREGQLVDGVVDLLVETVHRLSTRSRRKVVGRLAREIERVHGKERLLAEIAEASITNPEGAVRAVIFPVADEATLEAIVRERRAGGDLNRQIRTTMRRSYAGHYRPVLPKLLAVLEFRCNNAAWRPVLDALAWIARMQAQNRRFVPTAEAPLHAIPEGWHEFVIDPRGRVNVINAELCVLTRLRECLRAKEIWVVGADRYRNPDEDLPADFEAERDRYYASLNLTRDAGAFTAELQGRLGAALRALDAGLPHDPKVRLRWHGQNRIVITPFEPAPEPVGLAAVKAEVDRRWPMTGLLDVLKESALATGFLDAFETSASREALPRAVRDRRLLLCLYGLGTNAGLKRVAAGTPDAGYDELLHVRRRFIDAAALRRAAAEVVSATLGARDVAVWGEVGTACASDSTKFGAWDRNLMTEWHVRYGGRGVMIYWHVERRACCVYSQLKRCSSSEVAAMIEGVLRHCTDLEIQRQYVDSHGQSVVGFAFCHLLGFELAPRLKAIARQKLALPEPGLRRELPNLLPILGAPIDWDLIARQYDEMVKYAAAMRHRTADPEAILRRFARSEVMHPTYKALAELGRAVKTLFLCRYLGSEAFRREVHEGLNVVETWNGANGFVFFGKGGEMATNRVEDQEIAALALHLLQASLVYVNTRMMQSVLVEPAWARRLSAADYRGLSPLIYGHVNPYGRFDLDLGTRIDFQREAA
ncbi:MAG: Tn3 family transposase [Pseudomonadota bacterium]